MRNNPNDQHLHPGFAIPYRDGAGLALGEPHWLEPNWPIPTGKVPSSFGTNLMLIPITGKCGFYRLVDEDAK